MKSISNFWVDKKVFVTGATGLVGSWLVDELVSLNADVIVLIRDWVPKSKLIQKKIVDNITIVRGDLSSIYPLERILSEYEIDIVFHLAAQTIVPIANKNPLSTFESNIKGTWNLLESCRRVSNPRSIIIASSDKAYGDSDIMPYKETNPLNAVYPYDVSKACADMISNSYAENFNVPVSITRCGNFFGGGDLNWNRIIPGTIRSILRGKAPIIRSNGKLVRDYIYVKDAVSAYTLLAEKLFKNEIYKGQSFNFSNESQMSVLDLVELIIKIMDSKLRPQILNKNDGEIEKQYLNCTKAKELLGWSPSYNVSDALYETISWYKDFINENKL